MWGMPAASRMIFTDEEIPWIFMLPFVFGKLRVP